jgi:hypothetical protein
VNDHARAVVQDVGDLLQRAQVILDRGELADRHGSECRVLPVSAEDPWIVGIAGTDPGRLWDNA